MKKINFGFKKQKNNDALIKRNWKKIAIWSSVVAVLIAGIIPAIYFPVVMNKDNGVSEPVPPSLNVADVNEAVNKANNASEDEVWGLYIDIEENPKSDYAVYGTKTIDDDGNEEFDKTEFNGPFSEHIKYSGDEWLSFYDVTTEEATDMLAEFIWEINKEQVNGDYGKPVYEWYFEISMLDGEIQWDEVKYEENFHKMTVNKLDKDENGEEEETYELEFNGTTDVSGPMWLTFKGDDLIFVVTDIASTPEEGTMTEVTEFDELMNETSLVEYGYEEIIDNKIG